MHNRNYGLNLDLVWFWPDQKTYYTVYVFVVILNLDWFEKKKAVDRWAAYEVQVTAFKEIFNRSGNVMS